MHYMFLKYNFSFAIFAEIPTQIWYKLSKSLLMDEYDVFYPFRPLRKRIHGLIYLKQIHSERRVHRVATL